MVANAGVCSHMSAADSEPCHATLLTSVEHHYVARPQSLWIIGKVSSPSTCVESSSAANMLVYK